MKFMSWSPTLRRRRENKTCYWTTTSKFWRLI